MNAPEPACAARQNRFTRRICDSREQRVRSSFGLPRTIARICAREIATGSQAVPGCDAKLFHNAGGHIHLCLGLAGTTFVHHRDKDNTTVALHPSALAGVAARALSTPCRLARSRPSRISSARNAASCLSPARRITCSSATTPSRVKTPGCSRSYRNLWSRHASMSTSARQIHGAGSFFFGAKQIRRAGTGAVVFLDRGHHRRPHGQR